MTMRVYDHTRSQWAAAAERHLEAALADVRDGRDALQSVSAAEACLRIEAGELAPDADLLGEVEP